MPRDLVQNQPHTFHTCLVPNPPIKWPAVSDAFFRDVKISPQRFLCCILPGRPIPNEGNGQHHLLAPRDPKEQILDGGETVCDDAARLLPLARAAVDAPEEIFHELMEVCRIKNLFLGLRRIESEPLFGDTSVRFTAQRIPDLLRRQPGGGAK